MRSKCSMSVMRAWYLLVEVQLSNRGYRVHGISCELHADHECEYVCRMRREWGRGEPMPAGLALSSAHATPMAGLHRGDRGNGMKRAPDLVAVDAPREANGRVELSPVIERERKLF